MSVSLLHIIFFLKTSVDDLGLRKPNHTPPVSRSRLSSHENNSSLNSDSEENSQSNSAKIKIFFQNIMKLTNKRTHSNPNLKHVDHFKMKPLQSRNVSTSEANDNINRFLTIDSIQSETIADEYRKSDSFVASKRDFRNLYRRSVENANFNSIGDFYYWIFSQPTNLMELLISEKSYKETSEKRPIDSCYYVSMNWNFMRELYNCLVKLV